MLVQYDEPDLTDAEALWAKEHEGPLRFRHQLEEGVRTPCGLSAAILPRFPGLQWRG